MARDFKTIGVIGLGTMGAGITEVFARNGFNVVGVEVDDEGVERGKQHLHHSTGRALSRGKLTQEKFDQRMGLISGTLDYADIADADIVIEAVFEDIGVKESVFRKLDEVMKPGAILASNTSTLDLNKIAAFTKRPQDVIGLHFFSPANVMRLLEVVRGAASAPDALATGMAWGRRLGKLPLLTGNAFGFVGNRLYAAYRRQCEFLLEEGAWPEQVDAALQDFGSAMGPFAVADLSGLDIAWRMRLAQAATRDPAARYVDIPDRLCEAGRLGRKSGQGFFSY